MDLEYVFTGNNFLFSWDMFVNSQVSGPVHKNSFQTLILLSGNYPDLNQ